MTLKVSMQMEGCFKASGHPRYERRLRNLRTCSSAIQISARRLNSQTTNSVSDTTQRQQLRLLLRDGDGNVRVKITRTSLPESKDLKLERAREKEQWERFGYIVTYVAARKGGQLEKLVCFIPELTSKIIIYVRRWYLNDSVGSIELHPIIPWMLRRKIRRNSHKDDKRLSL